MRVNEFYNQENDLFDEQTVEQVVSVVIQGESAWSKPMSADDAIAAIMSMTGKQSGSQDAG